MVSILRNKKLCDNEYKFCFNNSFVSVKNSKYLSKKKINPRSIRKFSNTKYFFDCNTCDHVFESVICSVSKDN